MIRTFLTGIFSLAWCLASPLRADIPPSTRPGVPGNAITDSTTNRNVGQFHISSGPDDGRIAFLTARMLEKLHYLQHPFDDTISSGFLDFYLESLDPQHLHFLQSDLSEFDHYRTNLDNLTLMNRGVADVTPAYEILGRFIERVQQRVAHADDLLQREKFEFNSDERMAISRHDLPYPQNLDEAKQLWRQRLRSEYLQEKLSLENAKKPATTATNAVKTIHQQIVEILTHRYHRSLRIFADWNNEDVLGVYLTALAHVYDPHSDYLNRGQLDSFAISMNLALFGIGAQLVSDDGYCKILKLLPGGPAEKSNKVKEGDRIVAVAQGDQPAVDVVDMSLIKAVQLIRGPKGTEVRLTIIPAGADSSIRKLVSLIRDEIPLEDQAAKGQIIDLPNGKGEYVRLGVIYLPSFYAAMELDGSKPAGPAKAGKESPGRSTSMDVAKLLAKFKRENVNGVILDLRRNGGGSLEEAIRLTGLFIKEGSVVQVRASDGGVIVAKDADPSVLYEGPLVVLTSRFSASASEIVAGALQDYGRALIVGDSATYGKGTVQSLNYLKRYLRPDDPDTNNPGALKATVQKFYRASGASTQKEGVLPDIVLPSVVNYANDVGESSLENPLRWDTISSAPYEKLNLVQPYLADLLKRSAGRVAASQDFVYVREDIEQYRKRQADKTISLNEKQRLKEMEESESRQKARNKERLARKEPDEKIYEITLKEADAPGLPLPLSAQKTNSFAQINTNGASGPARTNSNASVSLELGAEAGDDSDEAKPPMADVNLEETKHIMLDYLSLLATNGTLLADHQKP